MDGLLDFLNIDFLHNHLPSSWFDNAHSQFGTGLTDDMIVQSVQEASDFFNMNAPMNIHEDWTTGVMTGMKFTENDDILIFNREQMHDMGITDKEGFDLVMTHEGAHRKLQGIDTGFNDYQEELCCDYMAGIRAGLNGMDEGKMEASLENTSATSTHPGGLSRVAAIKEGVAYAHEYLESHDGTPPTFSECLEHFNQTNVYDSTLHAYHHGGQYGNATGDYWDDSHPTGNEKFLWIDDRDWHMKEAEKAEHEAQYHEKEASAAAGRGDISSMKSHESSARSYRQKAADERNSASRCTK